MVDVTALAALLAAIAAIAAPVATEFIRNRSAERIRQQELSESRVQQALSSFIKSYVEFLGSQDDSNSINDLMSASYELAARVDDKEIRGFLSRIGLYCSAIGKSGWEDAGHEIHNCYSDVIDKLTEYSANPLEYKKNHRNES